MERLRKDGELLNLTPSLNTAASLLVPTGNKETFLGKIQRFLISPRILYLNCIALPSVKLHKPETKKFSLMALSSLHLSPASPSNFRKGPFCFPHKSGIPTLLSIFSAPSLPSSLNWIAAMASIFLITQLTSLI